MTDFWGLVAELLAPDWDEDNPCPGSATGWCDSEGSGSGDGVRPNIYHSGKGEGAATGSGYLSGLGYGEGRSSGEGLPLGAGLGGGRGWGSGSNNGDGGGVGSGQGKGGLSLIHI